MQQQQVQEGDAIRAMTASGGSSETDESKASSLTDGDVVEDDEGEEDWAKNVALPPVKATQGEPAADSASEEPSSTPTASSEPSVELPSEVLQPVEAEGREEETRVQAPAASKPPSTPPPAPSSLRAASSRPASNPAQSVAAIPALRPLPANLGMTAAGIGPTTPSRIAPQPPMPADFSGILTPRFTSAAAASQRPDQQFVYPTDYLWRFVRAETDHPEAARSRVIVLEELLFRGEILPFRLMDLSEMDLNALVAVGERPEFLTGTDMRTRVAQGSLPCIQQRLEQVLDARRRILEANSPPVVIAPIVSAMPETPAATPPGATPPAGGAGGGGGENGDGNGGKGGGKALPPTEPMAVQAVATAAPTPAPQQPVAQAQPQQAAPPQQPAQQRSRAWLYAALAGLALIVGMVAFLMTRGKPEVALNSTVPPGFEGCVLIEGAITDKVGPETGLICDKTQIKDGPDGNKYGCRCIGLPRYLAGK